MSSVLGGEAGGAGGKAFYIERAYVELKDSGRVVLIERVNHSDGSGTARDVKTGATVAVTASLCSRAVPPAVSDRILVVNGSYAGIEGTLVCLDGSDAIFKQDAEEEFIIVDVQDVAIIQRPSGSF